MGIFQWHLEGCTSVFFQSVFVLFCFKYSFKSQAQEAVLYFVWWLLVMSCAMKFWRFKEKVRCLARFETVWIFITWVLNGVYLHWHTHTGSVFFQIWHYIKQHDIIPFVFCNICQSNVFALRLKHLAMKIFAMLRGKIQFWLILLQQVREWTPGLTAMN